MSRVYLNLKFATKRNYVDFNLNHKISSFIYSVISSDYKELHEQGKNKFTFSNIMYESFKVLKNVIQVNSDRAALIISSHDKKFIEDFLKNLDKNKVYVIDNLVFKISDIKVDSTELKNDLVLMKTITPVVIDKKDEKGKRVYLSPNDSEFKDFFLKNLIKKTETNINLGDIIFEINQKSVKRKSIKLKENQTVKGHEFEFILKCSDLNLLNKAFYSGFGSKNSAGFGMVQVVKQ